MATDGSGRVAVECSPVGTVLARIVTQGCNRREDQDDLTSLFFLHRESGLLFSIPRPLENSGYTQEHLTEIEIQLARLGLDLFPLDHNLHYLLPENNA